MPSSNGVAWHTWTWMAADGWCSCVATTTASCLQLQCSARIPQQQHGLTAKCSTSVCMYVYTSKSLYIDINIHIQYIYNVNSTHVDGQPFASTTAGDQDAVRLLQQRLQTRASDVC